MRESRHTGSFSMKTAATELARVELDAIPSPAGAGRMWNAWWPHKAGILWGRTGAMQSTLLTGRQISNQPRPQQPLGSEGRARGRDICQDDTWI